MDRRFRCAAVSAMFVISLSCEISEAADPGFYVGAAAGRSEQRLDQEAGVAPLPISVLTPPDGGFNPSPFPPGPVPCCGGPVYGAVPLEGDISADEVDVGWNFALGYRVNEYFAAELAYVDAGEASLTERYSSPATGSFPATQLNLNYRVRSRGPAVSLLGSLPLTTSWEVFVRGGVFFASQEVESRTSLAVGTASNARQIARDYSDEVVSAGAGVQWAFLPRWTARLEYQRTDDLKSNDIMGESRLDQASLSVLFGL
ncbi:MAG TPA: outer membrane beta-barrel protein [Steroidobacter sp.]|uniref:outer membrane beta-barrel protein n=1 Tax=Steroidobacter sp. TaxID=1978227 RepID=UPI002EDAAF43